MKKVIVIAPNGERTKFSSAAEAARRFNVSLTTLFNWITGKTQPTKELRGCQIIQCEEEEVDNLRYETTKTGQIISNSRNILNWLMIHYDNFAYNEWTGFYEIDGSNISDDWVDDACVLMENEIGVNNDKKIRQCITHLCLKNSYHPLKEKIESFEWDGKPRAESFFIDFLGAHNTELNKFYTRCWFKAAMKRLYEPGCMWDNMIILYDNKGGTGKTKILERLSLGFYASNPDINNKDVINIMNSAWLVNFDELAKFDKKEMNSLKTFISASSEVNRLAYARYAKNFNRHCVFCGTTNDKYILRDYTSERERRFWIINCDGQIRNDSWWKENLPNEYIEQVWAEVKSWYDETNEINNSMSIDLKDQELKVQFEHKSFKKDLRFMIKLEQAMNAKYSKLALDNFDVFEREIKSSEYGEGRVFPLDKIEVKKIAAALERQEDYTSAAITLLDGWIVRDGWAIKTNQLELQL